MMYEEKVKQNRVKRRVKRIRNKILEAKSRARLTVFASNKYFYAQIIDDVKGDTLLSVTEKELGKLEKMTKTARAVKVGEMLAKKAKDKKIAEVVFDKGRYKYHGRVKAFADAARSAGLNF
jgi:large subunit ribosomal protein L18